MTDEALFLWVKRLCQDIGQAQLSHGRQFELAVALRAWSYQREELALVPIRDRRDGTGSTALPSAGFEGDDSWSSSCLEATLPDLHKQVLR